MNVMKVTMAGFMIVQDTGGWKYSEVLVEDTYSVRRPQGTEIVFSSVRVKR